MRKSLLTTVLFLIVLAGQSQTKNFIDQPYIEVNGTADTAITPNEIYIKIIISEADTKNKISVEDLDTKMVNALKTLGINTETDLTTSDVASNFKYYFLKGKDILKTKEYILKVGDAVTMTKVITQLEDLGISNTSIDRVDHSNLENIKNTMRTKAVENAKARALALTKPLNQNIGTAIHITDAENSNQLQGTVTGIYIRGKSSFRSGDVDLPKIEFEKIQITMTVNVAFILK